MKPSNSAPSAAGASRLWRRPHIVLPAVVLAAAGLAAPALHLTGSAEPARADVAAAAITAQVEPARPAKKVASLALAKPDTAAAKPEAAEERAERVTTASVAPAAPVHSRKVEALSDDDPRWGRAGAPAEESPEPLKTAELRSQLEALKQDTKVSTAADPAPAAEIVEAAATQASSADIASAAPVTAFAEPEPAAAAPAMPAPPQQETSTETAAAMPAPAEDAAPEATDEPADVRTARVKTAVNMRAGPENEATVLTVLPSGAEIGLVDGCKHWCEVTYDGRRGYVYKSFLSGT